MKPSDAPRQNLVVWRPRAEAEFLPAALEIVETPASPAGRAIAGAIIAFFVVALAWAAFGQVDIIATAQGRVVPAGEVKVIQPLEAGTVHAIHVEDGDQVHAGDVLIELDPTLTGADRERLSTGLIQAKLDAAEFSALKQQIDASKLAPNFVAPREASARESEIARAATEARAAEQAAKLGSIDQQISQKKAELDGVQAMIAKLDAIIPVLQEKEQIRRDLLEKLYSNKFAYLDAQQQLLDATHEREVQSHHLVEITSAQKALERQHEEARSNYAVDVLAKLSDAEEKVSELTQELLKADHKAKETQLFAPTDGTVQQLSVHTLGGVVTPAEPLMVIVPRDRELRVEAIVSNSDVEFVHTGQDVEVKVETFTFTRYGLLHGHVVDVSPDTVTRNEQQPTSGSSDVPGNRDDRQPSSSPSYVAHIALDRARMVIDGEEQPLGPGMAVTAEIKTGRRTIIEYLLSPLVAHTSESLRER